jgi:hypothetical protein
MDPFPAVVGIVFSLHLQTISYISRLYLASLEKTTTTKSSPPAHKHVPQPANSLRPMVDPYSCNLWVSRSGRRSQDWKGKRLETKGGSYRTKIPGLLNELQRASLRVINDRVTIFVAAAGTQLTPSKFCRDKDREYFFPLPLSHLPVFSCGKFPCSSGNLETRHETQDGENLASVVAWIG